MFVLISPDKFKGTMTALEVASAMAQGADAHGIKSVQVPLADGGEGLVDVFGGKNRVSNVTGPLGEKVDAGWRLEEGRAIIEMASASGLTLIGGALKNDPMSASSIGTGQLIAFAIEAGATHIIVGAGGSACTDGGVGAVEILRPYAPLDGSRGVLLHVACDVQTLFLQAAEMFGSQKGATPIQIQELTKSLSAVAKKYKDEFMVDVTLLPGSGAAGGFAGGMAALGASIVNGFDLVAEELDFDSHLRKCDFVLTGEGSLDQSSFEGKVVGSVLARAKEFAIPCGVIAGRIAGNVKGDFDSVSLVDQYGSTKAMNEAAKLVESSTYDLLQDFLLRQSIIKGEEDA